MLNASEQPATLPGNRKEVSRTVACTPDDRRITSPRSPGQGASESGISWRSKGPEPCRHQLDLAGAVPWKTRLASVHSPSTSPRTSMREWRSTTNGTTGSGPSKRSTHSRRTTNFISGSRILYPGWDRPLRAGGLPARPLSERLEQPDRSWAGHEADQATGLDPLPHGDTRELRMFGSLCPFCSSRQDQEGVLLW